MLDNLGRMLGNWSGRFLREVGESELCLERCRENVSEVQGSAGSARKCGKCEEVGEVRGSGGKWGESGRKFLFRQASISLCSLAVTHDY